jgi:hypothetical protein
MTRAALAGERGKVPRVAGVEDASAAHDWPDLRDCACERDVRECVTCAAMFSLPACLTMPSGLAVYGRNVCLACASACRPHRPIVRTRHGDTCPCWVCVDTDRSDQRSKYTGEQDE